MQKCKPKIKGIVRNSWLSTKNLYAAIIAIAKMTESTLARLFVDPPFESIGAWLGGIILQAIDDFVGRCIMLYLYILSEF